ncbi:multimeric flavodoxin WrbA [Aquimarina sp. EL_43]|uniref:flavodoxin family protein n=1 Tax=unclassified Aquimarina TaxID=2627091 RepID=UPI0018CB345C|nr:MULTISPECIES: NAD(P)H-dependent oxidoreductase [unclassified Aquimarina]MBG6130019.1 multimeric flavodoxin WrbA [Aquimarina sp. EL_35]MBG6148799.1 multimeric flavodoxin WrbA [Aquimarina sp. EL_32]MBG6168827.1 multimeric flavodoxin WrbA [Aquimarina sp. EL_43]
MKKGIIILGSSNSNGDTYKAASFVSQQMNYSIIDLKTKNISEFDYEFKNRDDDFHPLIHEIVNQYDLIIFATPVYWYTMSGILKTFLDRISDCLKIEKDTGRKLRGMEMAILSCGSDKQLKDGFHMPFVETSKYLGMKYIGDVHCWVENNTLPDLVETKLKDFINQIQ